MRYTSGQAGKWARRQALLVSLLVATAAPILAQEDGRSDSLRGVIQERFARQVQEQLGLTDDQADRMRTTAATWFARRRSLDLQERRLRAALAGQMRPGVPADQDSVLRLTEMLLDLKVAQVETYRDELREMSYLTPVQRAQFFILRDRLLRRIEEVRQEQADPPPRRRLRP
jgi:LTXXQ motif family protein